MNAIPFFRRLAQFTAVTALGAGLLLQAPFSWAQSAPNAAPQPDPNTPAAQSTAPAPAGEMRGMRAHSDAQVEAHLKRLHAQLKITPAEEDQWNKLAQVIRDNEHQIASLLDQRRQSVKSMSAVDNLRGYQEITQAHADGLKKLVPAFEALYSQMPDTQKKVADNVFNQRIRERTTARSKTPTTQTKPSG